MHTTHRKQTIAPDAHRVLRLLGMKSPYFQRPRLQEIGPKQEYSFISDLMLTAYYTGYGVTGLDGGVGLVLRDSNNIYNFSTTVPMSFVQTDTPATLAARVSSSVANFLTTNGLTAPDVEYFLFNPASDIRSEQSVSLSVQTSTGAVGTQVSATQDALVMVDLSAATTASIAGNAGVDLVLEVAPTNSATAGDWVIKGRSGNAQALSLALTLQSVQTVKGQTIAYVPAGYYVKVRSTGITGTVTTSVVEARAVLL